MSDARSSAVHVYQALPCDYPVEVMALRQVLDAPWSCVTPSVSRLLRRKGRLDTRDTRLRFRWTGRVD